MLDLSYMFKDMTRTEIQKQLIYSWSIMKMLTPQKSRELVVTSKSKEGKLKDLP